MRHFVCLSIALAVFGFSVAHAGAAERAPGALETRVFDATKYSQQVVECDRRAGHPEDPNKVVPGVEMAQMDLPAAIAACRADLARDPGNPRLLYQLARALSYSGKGQEALPFIEKAAALGYPQAIFVTGYLYLEGLFGVAKDPCRAGEYIRESALYGRMAGQIGFPAYTLQGRFEGCKVRQDRGEMIAMLERAKAAKPGYYPGVLADTLLVLLERAEPPSGAR